MKVYSVSVVLHVSPFLSTEILNKCKGDLLEMKETKLKTQPSFLENLIFFVEVRNILASTHSFSVLHSYTEYKYCNILMLFCTDGLHSLVDG